MKLHCINQATYCSQGLFPWLFHKLHCITRPCTSLLQPASCQRRLFHRNCTAYSGRSFNRNLIHRSTMWAAIATVSKLCSSYHHSRDFGSNLVCRVSTAVAEGRLPGSGREHNLGEPGLCHCRWGREVSERFQCSGDPGEMLSVPLPSCHR